MATLAEYQMLSNRLEHGGYKGLELTLEMVCPGVILNIAHWSGDPHPFFVYDSIFLMKWEDFLEMDAEVIFGIVISTGDAWLDRWREENGKEQPSDRLRTPNQRGWPT